MAEVFFHPTMVEKFPWAVFPTLHARSPMNRATRINLELSKEFIVGNLRKNIRTPIYQAWAHLAAQLPPSIPNISVLQARGQLPHFTTLEQAHACFRGVERPHDCEENGDSLFVYVVKVPLTVRFDNRPPLALPIVQRLAEDLVLTAIVAQTPLVAAESVGGDLQDGTERVWGRVLKIEVIEAASDGEWLPIGHKDRYDARIW